MRFLHLPLVLAPMLLLLAGCSAPGISPLLVDAAAPVPSAIPSVAGPSPIPSNSKTSSAPVPVPVPESPRPVFHLNDSAARRAALNDRYSRCLLSHGAVRASGADIAPAAGDGITGILVRQPVPHSARVACGYTLPLNPPELASATNRHFSSDVRANVACLRQREVWVTPTGSTVLAWTFTRGHSTSHDSTALERACLSASFGRH